MTYCHGVQQRSSHRRKNLCSHLPLRYSCSALATLCSTVADNDDDDKRNNWSSTNFCKLYAPTFNSSAHNYLLTTIHNVIKSCQCVYQIKATKHQIQEQDYATTYKLTRIAPFYSNMQKEQTTADHILLITQDQCSMICTLLTFFCGAWQFSPSLSLSAVSVSFGSPNASFLSASLYVSKRGAY